MSTALSNVEASALLQPDPPIEIEQSLEKDKSVTGHSGSFENEGVDKSEELLNFEHDDDIDDDELEALRIAALQSRKQKKPEKPSYSFKQHPSRNNLTQIVLGAPPTQPTQNAIPKTVALPDTSLPPPGYVPISAMPTPGHVPAYGLAALPPMVPAMTLPPTFPPTHIPPPLSHQPVIHHESTYHPTEFFGHRDLIGEKESRNYASYHSFRDRSPEFWDKSGRRRSPYGRDKYYRDKYYARESSPSHMYRRSPGKDREGFPPKRISREKRISGDAPEKTSKFSRYNSASEDESDISEEEVEVEMEVTASESEEEAVPEESDNICGAEEAEGSKRKESDKADETKSEETQMVEADDVLNVVCTEEIDEFTNFLNEFEDELKEKPKTGLKTKSNDEAKDIIKNKEHENGTTIAGKKKKTKIVKRLVKKPKRKRKHESQDDYDRKTLQIEENQSLVDNQRWSPKRRFSKSPYRDQRYPSSKHKVYSPDTANKLRQRTPTLSPEPHDKKLRFDSRHTRDQGRVRSPHKEATNETKSMSLPPSKASRDERRSTSRGTISQSRDSSNMEKDGINKPKETPEEREERKFEEKLRLAATQEERDKLIARRQKFQNTAKPIELTKKVISLKSKADHEEPLNEKRMRHNALDDVSDQPDNVNREGNRDSKLRLSVHSRLTLDNDDDLSFAKENKSNVFNDDPKTKGNVIDLRAQLSKKRLQGQQNESLPLDTDARKKLSKINSLHKTAIPSTIGRKTPNNHIANTCNELSEDDDSLDPLEKATVEDVSPRHNRQIQDIPEDMSSKSRVVLRDSLIAKRRKVEAFPPQQMKASINDQFTEYSDEEQLSQNSHAHRKKNGSRISVLDRLGKPVHNKKLSSDTVEDFTVEYQHTDKSAGFDHINSTSVEKERSKSYPRDEDTEECKKSKREKREKKEKKEKKKLKELKKLEKKLKKLTAKKRNKKSDKNDSNASDTEDDYDDRIEYFISEDELEGKDMHKSESKLLKQKKSSQKAPSNKRRGSEDSNNGRKEEKEHDSDDELFAFFEKDEGQSKSRTSSLEKKNETRVKSHTAAMSSSSASTIESSSRGKKESKKATVSLAGNGSSLMSKIKKRTKKP